MNRSNFLARNTTSLVLLVTFIIAAVIVFYLQITNTFDGPNNDILFDALEFFLSVAIGWFIQSIAAREDLQRNLRQYAISAYRRISDISRSVIRMHKAIEQITYTHRQSGRVELGTLQAIAEELYDTVSSSRGDWADIIGPELEKVQMIRELREKIPLPRGNTKTTVDDSGEKMTIEIKKEIEKLRSDLPYLLQAVTIEEDSLPREGRYSKVVASHIRNELGAKGAIDLPVMFIGEYSEEARKKLEEEAPLSLVIDQEMFKLHLGICNNSGNLLGEALNPFDDAQIYHNDYIVTFLQFVGYEPIDHPSGIPSQYPIPDYEIIASSIKGVDFFIRIHLKLEVQDAIR